MWKKLLDPQGYGLAIILALVLHGVVIALFAIQWPEEKRQVAEPTPRNIQAKVIQTENKKVKQQRQAKKKREEQRIKDENWKKYLAKKKAAKDKAVKAEKARKDKIKKENAKKAQAKKKADDALKLKKAEALKEEQLKEQQRKEEALKEAEAFEREQEAALLESLANEEQQRSMEKALADEQQAQKNAAITDDIAAQIRAKISQAWRYPPSARPDMRVEVRIQLVPTGEVINASLVTSSGNEALDRSVLAAVKRAEPLPVPEDSRLFEQQFRSFSMGFSPKDAVW